MKPGGPTLEPIAALDLQVSPTGLTETPRFQFAADSLFVVSREWDRWTTARCMYHAPTVCLVVAMVCILLIVRHIVRNRSVGRVVGRAYCAGCRHELVEPQVRSVGENRLEWADETACCPECGSRYPVYRWPLWRRRFGLGSLALIALLSAAGYGFHATTDRADPARRWTERVRWPFPELASAAPRWTVCSRVTEEELSTSIVRRISLENGAISILFRAGRMTCPAIASEDGQIVAQVADYQPSSIRYLDRSSGAIRDVRVSESSNDYCEVMGFSRDHARIYARRLRPRVEPKSVTEPRGEIVRIDVATGNVETIARSVFSRKEIDIGGWSWARAVEDEQGLRWFYFLNAIPGPGPTRMLGVVGTPSEERRYWITPAPFQTGTWDGDPESIPLADPSPHRVTTRERWMFSESRLVTESDRGPTPTGGERLLIAPSSPNRSTVSTSATVRDIDAGEPFATLRVNGQASNWHVSPDGRYVVAIVNHTERTWIGALFTSWPPRRTATLVVWDLGRARDDSGAP